MENKSFDVSIGRESAASESSFLAQVFFWMSMGLGLTGLVAGWMALNPSLIAAFVRNTGLLWTIFFVQLGIVFWLSSQVMRLNLMTATAGFSIYATLNGIIFSSIFLIYTGASIASTFLVTAGMFAAVSLYGFTTKRDLTSAGSFAFMALIGVIIGSLVNLFLKSAVFYWVMTYVGIGVFTILTAYDVQKLKLIHQQGFESGEVIRKMALLGALTLYLDFINMFLLLLRVMGRRK